MQLQKTTSKICWMCDTNFAFVGYEGTLYLSDSGDKPCVECLQEIDQSDDKSIDND